MDEMSADTKPKAMDIAFRDVAALKCLFALALGGAVLAAVVLIVVGGSRGEGARLPQIVAISLVLSMTLMIAGSLLLMIRRVRQVTSVFDRGQVVSARVLQWDYRSGGKGPNTFLAVLEYSYGGLSRRKTLVLPSPASLFSPFNFIKPGDELTLIVDPEDPDATPILKEAYDTEDLLRRMTVACPICGASHCLKDLRDHYRAQHKGKRNAISRDR